MHARLSTFFFFNDTATTEIYTLSLHDALPISFSLLASPTPQQVAPEPSPLVPQPAASAPAGAMTVYVRDRKSTRLNSSHGYISYAVICLKKKKKTTKTHHHNNNTTGSRLILYR